MQVEPESVLSIAGIGKSFAGVAVLEGISLDFRKGEVHAILGENGAGKSTLIKILSGYHLPDRGEIIAEGRRVVFRSPRDAMEASIHTIYQELTLCPLMTVAENIVIDKQRSFHGILQDLRVYRAIASEVLGRLGQADITRTDW